MALVDSDTVELDKKILEFSRSGNLKALRLILEDDAQKPYWNTDTQTPYWNSGILNKAFTDAVYANQYDIVQYLGDFVDIHFNDNEAFRGALKIGALSIIRYFVEKGTEITTADFYEAANNTFINPRGRFAVIVYLVETLEKKGQISQLNIAVLDKIFYTHISYANSDIAIYSMDHLLVLENVEERSSLLNKICKYILESYAFPIEKLKMLKYLVEKQQFKVNGETILREAVYRESNFEVVKYLLSRGATVSTEILRVQLSIVGEDKKKYKYEKSSMKTFDYLYMHAKGKRQLPSGEFVSRHRRLQNDDEEAATDDDVVVDFEDLPDLQLYYAWKANQFDTISQSATNKLIFLSKDRKALDMVLSDINVLAQFLKYDVDTLWLGRWLQYIREKNPTFFKKFAQKQKK